MLCRQCRSYLLAIVLLWPADQAANFLTLPWPVSLIDTIAHRHIQDARNTQASSHWKSPEEQKDTHLWTQMLKTLRNRMFLSQGNLLRSFLNSKYSIHAYTCVHIWFSSLQDTLFGNLIIRQNQYLSSVEFLATHRHKQQIKSLLKRPRYQL